MATAHRSLSARAVAVVGGIALVAVMVLLGCGPASATVSPSGPVVQVEDSSTTTVAPTTTTEPTTTTTTVPATTTSTAPPSTTTSTGPAHTTTTEPASTTTTTTATGKPASSKTPWALIVVIVVLVIAIVVVALVLASRKRRGLERQWQRVVVPALSDARLARESLRSGNAESTDPEVRGAVSVQVDRAANALDHAASSAPDEAAAGASLSAAAALRGLAFAIEADRLLRQGGAGPSGVQLAQADEARRARGSELDTALARLSTRVGPERAARTA
jgi:uncharacterized membrane protein